MSVPSACQKIADDLNALQDERNSLAEDLKDAAPGEKSSIAGQIKQLNSKITNKKNELNDCIAKNTPQPKTNPCLPLKQDLQALVAALQKEVKAAVEPLQEELKTAVAGQKVAIANQIKQTAEVVKAESPLTPKIQAKQQQYIECLVGKGGKLELYATFKGTATLTTNDPNASGPYKQGVNIGLYFGDWDRRFVRVTSFPSISVSYETGTPAGKVTTTVSMIADATGTFDAAANSIELTVPLLFHHSTIWAGASTLLIPLGSTAPMGADGKVTVSGWAKFKDGYLDGETCWLTVEGAISPRP